MATQCRNDRSPEKTHFSKMLWCSCHWWDFQPTAWHQSHSPDLGWQGLHSALGMFALPKHSLKSWEKMFAGNQPKCSNGDGGDCVCVSGCFSGLRRIFSFYFFLFHYCMVRCCHPPGPQAIPTNLRDTQEAHESSSEISVHIPKSEPKHAAGNIKPAFADWGKQPAS